MRSFAIAFTCALLAISLAPDRAPAQIADQQKHLLGVEAVRVDMVPGPKAKQQALIDIEFQENVKSLVELPLRLAKIRIDDQAQATLCVKIEAAVVSQPRTRTITQQDLAVLLAAVLARQLTPDAVVLPSENDAIVFNVRTVLYQKMVPARPEIIQRIASGQSFDVVNVPTWAQQDVGVVTGPTAVRAGIVEKVQAQISQFVNELLAENPAPSP